MEGTLSLKNKTHMIANCVTAGLFDREAMTKLLIAGGLWDADELKWLTDYELLRELGILSFKLEPWLFPGE